MKREAVCRLILLRNRSQEKLEAEQETLGTEGKAERARGSELQPDPTGSFGVSTTPRGFVLTCCEGAGLSYSHWVPG